MSIYQAVIGWRKQGRHLPHILRDFHDQKEVFKLVDSLTRPTEGEMIQRPTWVEAHVYTIDVFLWCMARHGYTLQRSRARLPFESLEDNIQAMRQREALALAALLRGSTHD